MAQNILVNSIIMFQEQLYLLKELTQNHFFICGRDMVFHRKEIGISSLRGCNHVRPDTP